MDAYGRERQGEWKQERWGDGDTRDERTEENECSICLALSDKRASVSALSLLITHRDTRRSFLTLITHRDT